jgi:hypothetical protein
MKELHESEYDPYRFEPNEGQRGLLCSNNESLSRCPSLRSNVVLTKDSLSALEELGGVLKPIYLRMKKEGYGIVDGRVVNLNENE